MSFRNRVTTRPCAVGAFVCQQLLAGVDARRSGWHLVVDGQLPIGGYPSERPVVVPV